jgi:DNA-binding PadR family transcriptional regulator
MGGKRGKSQNVDWAFWALLALADRASRHGWAIKKRIAELSNGKLQPATGILYPLLARLTKDGAVTRDEVGDNTLYRVTDDGMVVLKGIAERYREGLEIAQREGVL